MKQELRDELKQLRAIFPPLLPVRVYFRTRQQMGSNWGDCSIGYDDQGKPNRFIIRICEGQGLGFTQYLLRHEWAHAVAWREGHETVCDHDPEWALAFARIYQELIEP